MNVVVQWASYSRKDAVRMLITKSIDSNKVSSPVLEDLGQVDMGDYNTLNDFIAWGVKNFPAKHYFIDVWDHGSGWHRNGTPLRLNISNDDFTHHNITTKQLASSMAYAKQVIGHKVDIYGSDACFMAMVEVADQMSDSVRYYVGSQELEPGDGWNYQALLSQWEAKSKIHSKNISKILTKTYVDFYKDDGEGVTMAAYKLSEQAALNQALKNLAATIEALDPSTRDLVTKIARNSFRFAVKDYADLSGFVANLVKVNDVNLTQAANDVSKILTNYIVSNKTTRNYKNNAQGVSVWLPATYATYKQFKTPYDGLEFSSATGWNELLALLVTKEV